MQFTSLSSGNRPDTKAAKFAVIAALVLFGVILFALFCQVTGAVDFRQIVARLRRRA